MNGQDEIKMHEKKLEELTPKQIVTALDTYIIGQAKAKRSVAIALRNRTRRLKLDEDIREEIAPKNILMIGPTGVGKTEIARRLAKLCGAPFLKVEATKYTEVGYVGRDVESMIRDLMAVGFAMVQEEMHEKMKTAAAARVEEDLLNLLVPGSSDKSSKKAKNSDAEEIGRTADNSAEPLKNQNDLSLNSLGKLPDFSSLLNSFSGIPGASIIMQQGNTDTASGNDSADTSVAEKNALTAEKEPEEKTDSAVETDFSAAREKIRALLREGKLEEREVEITINRRQKMPSMEMFVGGNMDDIESAMQGITAMISGGNRSRKKTVTVAEAREILLVEHLDRMTDTDKVAEEAKRRVEQMGIIFIDEIDKIAVSGGRNSGQDVSREGVQRDILPIVEGSNVNTKYGVVDTTHILFIAAGAFNLSKPSDLIPELQGRFPLRVELDSLNADDFKRILLEPKNALTRQYKELLSTENVSVVFSEKAIERMSYLAADVNSRMENIGARRLHTIMETLLEDLSFDADEHAGETIEITEAYVDERLKDIVQDQDLSKYIL